MSRHPENKRDVESRESYRRMADVKSRLDRRPPRRPAPEVIDHIVDYAGTRAASSGRGEQATEQRRTEAASRRNERPPAQHPARRPFYSLVGAVAVSLVVIGLGWWQFTEVAESPVDAAVMSDQTRLESAATEQPPAQHAAPDNSQAPAVNAPGTSASATNAPGTSASGANASGANASGARATAAEWNRADDVYEVYRRIQMIRARGQASYRPAAASGHDEAAYATSTN